MLLALETRGHAGRHCCRGGPVRSAAACIMRRMRVLCVRLAG